MEKQVEGSWDLVREDGKTLLCARCPGCGRIIPLDEGYEVRYGELLPCIVHNCGYHEYVYLNGWNETHGRIWMKAQERGRIERRKRLRRIEAGLEQEWHRRATSYPHIVFQRAGRGDHENIIQIVLEAQLGGAHKRYRYSLVRLGGMDIIMGLSRYVSSRALHFYNSICGGDIATLLGKDMPRLRKKKISSQIRGGSPSISG